jgi:hypothetical protein
LFNEYDSATSHIDSLVEHNASLQSIVTNLGEIVFDSLPDDEKDIYMCAATLEVLGFVHRTLLCRNSFKFKFK